MNTSGNTILITGGATGIGYALAEKFLEADNEVIICGRRKERLDEAKQKLPKLNILQCDVSFAENRENLYKQIISQFKNINILVNNAGIQQMIVFPNHKNDEINKIQNEININLVAPIHLSALFIDYLKKHEQSAIINISSGLGYVPLAIVPVYCSTKAAIHSFTVSLRHQLKNTNIKVFEIIPPIVDTELGGGGRDERGMTYRGIQPSEVADETIIALENDEFDYAVGRAANLVENSKSNFTQAFNNINH